MSTIPSCTATGDQRWSQSFRSLRAAHMRGDFASFFSKVTPDAKLHAGSHFLQQALAYGPAAFNVSFGNPDIKGWSEMKDERGVARLPLLHLDHARRWPVYSESTSHCAVLFLSGCAVGAEGGLVIEMGTLSGASSRCLAAGLTIGSRYRRGLPAVFMAFDAFDLFPKRAMRAQGFPAAENPLWLAHLRAHEKKRSYETSVWHNIMVNPVYCGPALAWPGDIGKQAAKALSVLPEAVPVDLWSIDSAKSHPHFISQSRAVWPRLRAGSVVHLMDFSKHQLVFWLVEFVFRGDVSIVHISTKGAPWSFVVEKAPLDWSRVTDWCTQTRVLSPLDSGLRAKGIEAIRNSFDSAHLPEGLASGREQAERRLARSLAAWNHTKECL